MDGLPAVPRPARPSAAASSDPGTGPDRSSGERLPRLEFWPDHGDGPVWSAGRPADLVGLGVPPRLVASLEAFNAAYREDRVPVEGPGDAAYLAEGASLIAALRGALAGRFDIVVTEPWWGEPASEQER